MLEDNTASLSPQRAPDDQGPRFTSPFLLWFGFLGGAVAWALQFGIGYGLVEIACNSDRLAFTILGISAADLLSLLATLLAVLTALSAAVIAYLSQPLGIWGSATEESGAPEARGRSRFMAYTGVIMNVIFLLAIIAQALPFFFLRTC